MNFNTYFAIGHVTRDPEVKNVGTSKVATFRLAINRSFKKNNEWVDKPTFVDCEAWNQRAEYIAARIQKGTEVFVRGRLESDEWEKEDASGKIERRSKLKVYVLEIQAGKGRKEGAETTANAESEEIELPF